MQRSIPFVILVLVFLALDKLVGQIDTLYFFDFEKVDIQYGSAGKYVSTHNNGGTFQDAEPFLPHGKTVIRPNSAKRNSVVNFAKYDLGNGFLYHSPSWYMNEEYEGVSFNHIEVELDSALPADKFYKLTFLTGNFKSHRFQPAHYGIRFSEKKIIKDKPGGLLEKPDIFFDFKNQLELEQIQAIYFAEQPVNYIYFGIFGEDSERIPKVFTRINPDKISYSDTAAHVFFSKPTRILMDNILIEEMEKDQVKFKDVYFDTNKDELQDANDIALIKEIASYLNTHPENFILIQGYTDKSGTLGYNMDLSQRRANRIKEILLNNDVSEKQIVTLGKGIHNSKSASKENVLDRKVSFVIFK